MPKLNYYDTGYIYVENPESIHGRHPKDLIVLHETVSPDVPGLRDIIGVETYLANKKFGIHGMTDEDGNIAWARGFGSAVFYHSGGVNEKSIGIEQVARSPVDSPKSINYWKKRNKELRATAKLIASICNSWNIPLRFSDSTHSGITSHWNVSQYYPASQGHWDCHPRHLGGYYPIISVINLARVYSKLGLKL